MPPASQYKLSTDVSGGFSGAHPIRAVHHLRVMTTGAEPSAGTYPAVKTEITAGINENVVEFT